MKTARNLNFAWLVLNPEAIPKYNDVFQTRDVLPYKLSLKVPVGWNTYIECGLRLQHTIPHYRILLL